MTGPAERSGKHHTVFREVVSVPPDLAPSRAELLAEVQRLVWIAAGTPLARRTVHWAEGRAVIVREGGGLDLPAVGSTRWWQAPTPLRIAALLVLAEAYLIADPERQVRERLKAASVAVSEGIQEHQDLTRRRRDAIGQALRDGDATRAVMLTRHHASNRWWVEHPDGRVDAVTP